MLSIDQALAAFAAEISPLSREEEIPVVDALHRVLAAPACAAVALPPFPQSAVDGYAVLSADLAEAARAPISLKIVQEIAAGRVDQLVALTPGTCARIFTGAHLPPNCDAVVMQEVVARSGATATFSEPISSGRNVRAMGEELKSGDVLAAAGTRVSAGVVGALLAAGIANATVRRKPRVTVLVSGDELRLAGEQLRLGEVYECNGGLARAWFRSQGIEEIRVQHIGDNAEATRVACEQAFSESDFVVTTGGASVGDRDFLLAQVEAAGARRIFWKVAQQPGKPMFFAMAGEVPVLGLPGNPAAVFVGLVVHAARILELLEGNASPRRCFRAPLNGTVKPNAERDLLLRVGMEISANGTLEFSPLQKQQSHMLSNLGDCRAIARIKASTTNLELGTTVDLFLV